MSNESQNWQNNQTTRPGESVMTEDGRADRIIEVASNNRDPLTGEPGSHPVGVGAGTAAGVLAGAALGSIGGPIGTAIGAVVGGIAGGGLGKGVAEAVNPTLELEYWRSNFATRPYAGLGTFADYEPAYRAVIETTPSYGRGEMFEAAENRYREAYERIRGASKLDWSVARHASRDAWNRLAATTNPPVPNRVERSEESIAEVRNLVEILNDGAKGFQMASEKLSSAEYRQAAQRFAAQRERFSAELSPHANFPGKIPDSSGNVSGAVHRAWMGLRAAIGGGDRAIISECERGEDEAVRAYEKAMASPKIPADARQVISRQYTDVLTAHNQIRDWKHAFEGKA